MKRAALAALVVGLFLLLPGAASASGPGEVTGTVTPLAVAPEVEVCLVEAQRSETCTSPGADGTYSLTGVPVLTPLRVEFIPSYRSHYLVQYYDQARTLNLAVPIIVPPPSAPGKKTPLEHIDADLELGGSINGTVSAAEGPLAEVEVCALDAATSLSRGCTHSDEAGEYQLDGLPPGPYKAGFWGDGASAEYTLRYFPGAMTFAEASSVQVAAGMTSSDVDVAMTKGAELRGTVTAASGGAALEGIAVCLFAVLQTSPSKCTFSGTGGSYSLLGISAGNYQVGFSLEPAEIGSEAMPSDDNYLTQYYDDAATRAEATTLALAGGQATEGIDARLTAPPPLPPPLPFVPVATALVPPSPRIGEPQPREKPAKCKRGFVRQKTKAASHCVKRSNSKRGKHKKGKTASGKGHHTSGRRRGE
jgi:hypothetical protein